MNKHFNTLRLQRLLLLETSIGTMKISRNSFYIRYRLRFEIFCYEKITDNIHLQRYYYISDSTYLQKKHKLFFNVFFFF